MSSYEVGPIKPKPQINAYHKAWKIPHASVYTEKHYYRSKKFYPIAVIILMPTNVAGKGQNTIPALDN